MSTLPESITYNSITSSFDKFTEGFKPTLDTGENCHFNPFFYTYDSDIVTLTKHSNAANIVISEVFDARVRITYGYAPHNLRSGFISINDAINYFESKNMRFWDAFNEGKFTIEFRYRSAWMDANGLFIITKMIEDHWTR